MNVRNYSLALIVGSFVSTLALAQAPATVSPQPVEKSTIEQTKTTEMKHKDAANGSATTTMEKSAETKTAKTHDGKHVAKAGKTEESKSVVIKKEETAKSTEKSQDVKPTAPSTNQSSSK